MDDGTRGAKIKDKPAYNIATHSFSYDDQLILVNTLKKNFGVQSAIHGDKKYFKLTIKAESHNAFQGLIKAYIHPYFKYKL